MRILVIGMADSVHVARWLEMALQNQSAQVLLIPTSPHRKIHPKLLALLRSGQPSVDIRIHRLLRFGSLPIWALDKVLPDVLKLRSHLIARSLQTFQPDLIHVMESQNGGYPFSLAVSRSQARGRVTTPTLLTLFGSDLYWFKNFSDHRRRLKILMSQVSTISAECQRDIDFARELGFKGNFLPLVPVSGGLPDDLILSSPDLASNPRRSIAVKGLGHIAIQALAEHREFLTGKLVEIYSAGGPAIRAAKKHLQPNGIEFRIYKKHTLNHGQMLQLYRRSCVYVGLSKSDGLPASMLEAMSQGAYPVQTTSACTEGWVTDNLSATLISEPTVSNVSYALQVPFYGEGQLHVAQVANLKTIKAKYSKTALDKTGTWQYSSILQAILAAQGPDSQVAGQVL
jgi:hypothetical protein